MDKTNNSQDISPHLAKVENRNIQLFLSGKFVSMMGTQVYAFAISYHLLSLTGGLTFSLNFALKTIPQLLFAPVAGVLSDKAAKKRLVVVMDFLSGLSLIFLYIYSKLFGLGTISIYITTFALTSFNTFFSIAISSAIPSLVHRHKLIKINSYNSSINSISGILGPIVGGFLFALININYIIIINGISFIVSAISECFIDFNAFSGKKSENDDSCIESTNVEPSNTKKITFLEDCKEVVHYLKQNKALASLVITLPIINFFFTAITLGFPYISINVLAIPSGYMGLIDAVFGAGMLIAALILSKRKEFNHVGRDLGICIIIDGFLALLIALPSTSRFIGFSLLTHVVYISLVMFTFGLVMIRLNMPVEITLQKITPEEYLGRLYGILSTVSTGLMPIGAIIFGLLIDKVHVAILLSVSAFVFLVMGTYIMTNKNIKELR